MINEDRRAIFVHIQKTAGSSIGSAFDGRFVAGEKHFRADQLKALYGVRNPWDRLVSWWSMIDAQRQAFDRGQRFNNFQDYILKTARTFEEFLTRAIRDIPDLDGQKSILRNQIDYLVDEQGRLIVDFVGRFETLENDFQTVCRRIFGGPRKLPHVNTSAHAAYQEHYTDDLAALVAQRFARDVQLFGYTLDRN